MKPFAILAGLLVLAQAAQRPPVQISSQESNPAQGGEPGAVLDAEKAWAGGDVLWPLVQSGNAAVGRYALRAIGRLEDPANVPRLLAIGKQPGTDPAPPAYAIARSLKGFDPARDPEMIASVLAWLRTVTFVDTPKLKSVMAAPIGSVVYGNPEQVHAAEAVLLEILEWAQYDKKKAADYVAALQSLESLGRLNAKVTPFGPDTTTRLGRVLSNSGVNDRDRAREAAMAALIAGRGLNTELERVALRDPFDQVRRLATVVLAGAGAGLQNDERATLIKERLGDSNGQVRYEAVRGYARRVAAAGGCQPLLDAILDRDSHVALAALDALGDACKTDDEVTTRIVAESVPPQGPAWHRGAHAFVALAKRAPERAAIPMEAFATHPSWWVRMYAARAAAAAGDLTHLDKLAYDTNDNVRDAALGPLRRLKKADADAAIVAALDRADVQLLRSAALLLKESPPSARFARPLLTALLRLTKEGKETSRDARVPLLDALAVHASADNARELEPLLRDFDPVVAARAASLVTQLTGKTAVADSPHVSRGWPQQFADLRQCVSVNLDSGRSFRLRMNPAAAPVTVDRFLKLALVDHYYDGLVLHRLVPNFVLQGGGPGSNEYAGHKEYMRDELGARNSRGTVGLSTRGRNTADGQFYVNLVDNARLDPDYTVFASVIDMSVVEALEEGEVMQTITSIKCAR